MPENTWSQEQADEELDPISSLISEFSEMEEEEEEFRSDFFQGFAGRRRKAAMVLMLLWGTVIALYFVSWGNWAVIGLTAILSIQALRLVTLKPESIPAPLTEYALVNAPQVSLIVAAKNEEAVIARSVEMLCNLNYGRDKYEVWAIDDYSTDKTPQILDDLAQKYSCLKVLHRGAGASGGKSGALNQVLALAKGEIIGVFDADAKVTPDLLPCVVPMFDNEKMGALQVRKSIANEQMNWLTKGQSAEMILDGCFQQQRITIGGIGELRGNGQFVRRSALERCGKWNEQTITDDLDLTIRLHLDGWKIGFLPFPAVEEEGVTTVNSLWHQRSRWAEGGYQRYLDYWRLIVSENIGLEKRIDLLSFMFIQYLLPTASVMDFVMAIIERRFCLLFPLTVLMLSLSTWGMFNGLIRTNNKKKLSLNDWLIFAGKSFSGMIYMLHWLIVMPATIMRMAIRPKKLKWVKTVHQG